MDKRSQTALYVAADLVATVIAWTLFFLYRKAYLEPLKFHHPVAVELDERYWLGLVVLPIFWVLLFVMIGGYSDIFRRFRIEELGQTLMIDLIGSIVIFFALLLDDTIASPRTTTKASGSCSACISFCSFSSASCSPAAPCGACMIAVSVSTPC